MNLPAALRRLIPNEAQARYFALDKQAGRILRDLSYPMDLADRAGLISELADLEQDMADTHLAAFGPDPIEWEGGRDLADALANAARLLRIVSDAYYDAALNFEVPDDERAEPREGMDPVQLAAIKALTDAKTGSGRASALDGWLYAVFVSETGGQAAEVLIGLAYTERKTAEPGRRPCRPRAFPRFRAVRRVLRRVLPFAAVPVIGAVAFLAAGAVLNLDGTGTSGTATAACAALAVFRLLLPLTTTASLRVPS